jgi:hypothetical protein
LHNNAGLDVIGDTGEHARHRVLFSGVAKSPSARAIAKAERRQERCDRALQRLDWPQAQSYYCA